jgi:hypothetical protein
MSLLSCGRTCEPPYCQKSSWEDQTTPKIFHDHGITKLTTLQGSLGHLSDFLVDMLVPLLELLHDLWRTFKVFWIWFVLLYLFRTVRKPQVLPAEDRTKKVPQSGKQTSFRVTLLRESLLRQRTSQDLVRVHCCYYFSGFFFMKKNRFGLGGPLPWTGGNVRERGMKRDNFFFSIFFTARTVCVVNWPHIPQNTHGWVSV